MQTSIFCSTCRNAGETEELELGSRVLWKFAYLLDLFTTYLLPNITNLPSSQPRKECPDD